jgi:vacuolar-type H+-ATPase subunit I/STV1
MELIQLFVLPAWLLAGAFLNRSRGRASTIRVAAFLSILSYAVSQTGLAILARGWHSQLLRSLGISMVLVGYAALVGLLCSPAGMVIAVTPLQATIGRLLDRFVDRRREQQEALKVWEKGSTIAAATVAVFELVVIFLIARSFYWR